MWWARHRDFAAKNVAVAIQRDKQGRSRREKCRTMHRSGVRWLGQRDLRFILYL